MRSFSAVASFLVPLLFLGGSYAPSPPVSQRILPDPAFPRQIVVIAGDNLEGASVVWDAGLPSERNVLQVAGSARYFQIPVDATTESHQVRLKRGGAYFGNTMNVQVESRRRRWPLPRIEDIGINRCTPNPDRSVDFVLAVPVANVDPDARVDVNGSPVPSSDITFYSAVSNTYLNDPGVKVWTYDYPVFHYGLLLVELKGRRWGQDLTVKVINHTGESRPRRFDLPESMDKLDSDNDGLPDKWESEHQARIKCDPLRKDVLVEVDWMEGAGPEGGVLGEIQRVFEHAPVLNPDGSVGISLHIDAGGGTAPRGGGEVLPFKGTMDFCPIPLDDYADFYKYKARHFNQARLGIYHYCVFGNSTPMGLSGRGEIVGDDFIVTIPIDASDRASKQIGTFIHELGHNIALYHGGIDRGGADRYETLKPNQPSVMNYRWQANGIPHPQGDLMSSTPTRIYTFSEGMLRSQDEDQLEEGDAFTIADDMPVNLHSDRARLLAQGLDISRTKVYGDMNHDGDAADIHRDYDEWGNIRLPILVSDCELCVFCSGGMLWLVSVLNGPDSVYITPRLEGLYSYSGGGTPCPGSQTGCGIPMDSIACGKYIGKVTLAFSDTLWGPFFYSGPTDTLNLIAPNNITDADTITVSESPQVLRMMIRRK